MPVTIECDIVMTKDSVLMMLHDNTFERTTTGKGRVMDSSFAYSQSLLLKGTLGNLDKMAESRDDHLYLKWFKDGADMMSTDRPLEAWKLLQN